MNNLFQHIEYLLLTHDCVIVPGLGAFIANVRPATIDLDKGIILPPHRSVMFNQAVSSDDGLLANSYVRKYNISFEDARQIILRVSSLLREKIAEEKDIKVGNLGTLHLGEEGNLVFIPSSNIANSSSPLGFDSLFLNTVSADSDKATDPYAQTVVSEQPSKLSQEKNNKFRIGKSISKIAAAFIIIAAIITIALVYPIPTDNREQRASVVPVKAIMPITIALPTEEPETTETVMTDDMGAKEDSFSHYLIVATFSSNREAFNYITAHSSEDCQMHAIESKKVTRVAIASSNDRDKLRRQLNSKEIHSRYPNAWIWSRE